MPALLPRHGTPLLFGGLPSSIATPLRAPRASGAGRRLLSHPAVAAERSSNSSSSSSQHAGATPQAPERSSTLDALESLLGSMDQPASSGAAPSAASTSSSVTDAAPASRALATTSASASLQTSTPGSPAPVSPATQVWLDVAKDMAKKWVEDNLKHKSLTTEFLDLDGFHKPLVRPRAAWAMLGTNLAVYGAGLGARLAQGEAAGQDYFLALAKINAMVEAGEWHRLLTCNFLHDSFMHLVLNCYALYTVAPEVERELGRPTFLAIFILSGLTGSVVTFAVGDAVTVGASSAVFGLIGALGGYVYKNRDHLRTNPQQVLYSAGLAAVNLFMGFKSETTIDNIGHIGGLASGLLLGWAMAPKYARPAQLPRPDQAISQLPQAANMPAETLAPATQQPARRQPVAGDGKDFVDQTPPLQRWAACLGYATALYGILALTLFERTGHVPVPSPALEAAAAAAELVWAVYVSSLGQLAMVTAETASLGVF